jgi:hypothetical protein
MLGYLMEQMFQIYIDKYHDNDNTDHPYKKFQYMCDKVKRLLCDEDSQEEYEKVINSAIEDSGGYNPVSNLDDILMERMCSSLGIQCSKSVQIHDNRSQAQR